MSPLLIAIAAGGMIVAVTLLSRKAKPGARQTATDSGGWVGDTTSYSDDSSWSDSDCSSDSSSDSGGDCGGGDGGGD